MPARLGRAVAPDLTLAAGSGVAAWRLAGVLLLALAAAGLLVAVLVLRHRRAPGGVDARLGLWGHVAELRDRILWCAATWTAATLAVFSLRLEPDGGWRGLPRPVPALHDNMAAQAYRALARLLVPDGVQLVVLRPLDGFSAEFGVAMALGFAIALPVLLWHLFGFVGPALRPRERRVLRLTVLPAVALFAVGATFAATILAPLLLKTLYGYPEALGAQPFLLVDELVSFAVTLALVFGVASLTPLVMAGLASAGLVGWRSLLRGWRHATVAILVVCAFVTDGTLVTLAMVSAPLLGLYFVGVGLAAWTGRTSSA